jgi:hypothetical protein
VTWLPSLAAEFAITVSDGAVWLAIAQGLLFAAVCLFFGIWVARTVGLLRRDAPAGETVGVGLASGLMVLAAWWAALWSGGRSSFTPVAVGFAIALGLALARRVRRPVAAEAPADEATDHDVAAPPPAQPHTRSLILASLAGGAFVVVVALLYGSTLAPSPRDGVQPVEKTDIAFYAVLGRDLATTGLETNTPPSGFSKLPGVPAQAWYHWAELWLASAVITLLGTAPMLARYVVVLPVLLLAAAALTGAVVRRMNGTASRAAYLFGFLACLVLAPIPLILGPFFSVWAGLIAGITQFGLAAVTILFGLYSLLVLGTLKPGWPLACFIGSAFAFVLPAHVVIALLALVGVSTILAVRIGQPILTTRRLATGLPIWTRTVMASTIAVSASVAWGLLTDHGLGGGGPNAGLSAFNASWRDSIGIVTLEAGMFLAIPLACLLTRRDNRPVAGIYLGTMALLVAGAIVWGWGIATFNMFYFFFGAIAVFGVPVAAAAVWLLLTRLGATQHPSLAVGVLALCVVQLELAAVFGLGRLQGGSSDFDPIPISLLQAIRQLPPNAKLAYACNSFEEISFVNSKLLGIDAHTGRRVVPLCFEADVNGPLVGAEPSMQIPDAGFAFAPQLALYPNSTARPSSSAVASFLKANGIGYIYIDSRHPNSLVIDAIPIATSGNSQLLMVP